MKHHLILFTAALLVLPGCDKPAATTESKQDPQPVPFAAAFEAVPVQTIYSDSFESDPKADGWSTWQPQPAVNPNFATHEEESLRLTQTLRGLWQKKIPVPEGGIYRLSARVRTDDPGRSEFGIGVRPMDANQKFTAMLNQFFARNFGLASTTDWTRREVFWVIPAHGEINGQKLGGYDLEFITGQLPGSAWCDDLTVEKVRIDPPYYTNFETADEDWKWEVTFPGNESTGEVTHVAEGFGDAGSVRVTIKSGNAPGIAAARSLPASALAGASRWTLTAFAKVDEGKAIPRLMVQYYDSEGKQIMEATGPDMVAGQANQEAENWGMVELTFDLLEQAAEVRLLLANGGPDSSALFDNVLLRPAYDTEEAPRGSQYPVRLGVYPAEQIAAIDGSQPEITVNSGQAGGIGIFLSGDKNAAGPTLVEVELPTWLKLLAAEQPVWGEEPLEWETLPGRDARHLRYRFTNPYPWQELMMRGMPNHYTCLLLVVEPDAPPGTDGEALIQTRIGDKTGEERLLPVRVRETVQPVERSPDYRVGLWNLQWLNVYDQTVREKLLGTYAAAGFNLAQFRHDRPFLPATFEKLGMAPFVCIIPTPDMRDGYGGTTLLTDETAMRTNDGQPYRNHLAIGLALNDPVFREAYKKRLAFLLNGFPQQGGYAVLDLEYQGKNATRTACFHPSTIEAFRQWAKLPAEETLTSEVILSQHGEKWADFRLWAYAEVIRIAVECLREQRPEIQTINYAYLLEAGGNEPASIRIAPNSAVRADPYVDGHLISTSNRDGAAFIDALGRTIPYLKRPVWVCPFVMKEMGLLYSKNYPYWQISAREYRFQTVAAAALGARGQGGYPGYLLDADYLLALRDGVADIQRQADFYFRGKRDDSSVTLVEPQPSIRRSVHLLGERRLLTIFNGSDEPATVQWRYGKEERTTGVEGRGYAQVEL